MPIDNLISPLDKFIQTRGELLRQQGQQQQLAAQPQRDRLVGLQLAQGELDVEAQKQRILQMAQQKDAIDGLRSILQLRRINDPIQQDSLLKQRVVKLQAEGKDFSDEMHLLQTPFEQRAQKFDAVMQAGIQMGLLKAPPKPASTALVQNLVAAGLQPGTPEFQNAVRRQLEKPSGTQVSLQLPGEKAERTELGKIQAKRFEKIINEGEEAADVLAAIDQLDAMDVSTGIFEPAKVEFARIMRGFGFDRLAEKISDVSSAQSFKALTERMVNEVLNVAKGPQTDQDAERARRTMAQLGDDPKAAKFKNDSLRALALRKIERQEFIEKLTDSGMSFSQANAEWNKFKNKTPSLSAVQKDPETNLPMFYFQFKQKAAQIHPDWDEEKIIESWRAVNANR